MNLFETVFRALENVAHGPLCGLDACPGCEATDALHDIEKTVRSAVETGDVNSLREVLE